MLSAEEVAEAVSMRARGMAVERIAEHFHVHQTTLGRYLDGAGVPRQRLMKGGRRVSTEAVLRMGELVGQGYSATDIASLMGLSASAVRRRLRQHSRDGSWRGRPNKL
jgi:predicted transcriptional regulator